MRIWCVWLRILIGGSSSLFPCVLKIFLVLIAGSSTFTLLFQDSRGGLEFVNRETGEFMPADPQGDMLYLNIGDMFMRISNGNSQPTLYLANEATFETTNTKCFVKVSTVLRNTASIFQAPPFLRGKNMLQ